MATEHIERTLCEPRLSLKGVITVETRDAATGKLIPEESSRNENIVVDVGLVQLAKLIAQMAYSTGFQIGVGTSTTAAASTDTTLGASVLQAAVTSQTASGAVATFKLFIDTSQANGSILAEAGLFFDGVMLDRALLSATISKNSGKTVTVTIQLTLSR